MKTKGLAMRKARLGDVAEIAALVNGYADDGKMLHRTLDQVALSLDDYVVAVDARGRILACGALREYSPSVAEVSSIAVARAAQGRGLGSHIVHAVEALARRRGYRDVFLITVCPEFFETLGYVVVERALYPEKVCGHAVSLAACEECTKLCMWRDLAAGAEAREAA
ncbi:MAG TPA: GNAT family N-acetyltransferase [Gemmatimonadaceae bacterium]|nr:GNAT family N-acetyltransferase [Gemmatimonadaceae bacterium]